MQEHQAPVPSIGQAVSDGWSTMRRILFEPFDMGKWFVLGFTAWLAGLGEGGGSGGGGGGGGSPPGPGGGQNVSGVATFVQEYAAVIITVVAVVVILLFTVGLLVLWVRSRGKFMFLDNVVMNRAEVVQPWRTYRREGNALFLWTLVYSIVVFAVFLLIAAAGVSIAWPSITGRAFGPDAVMALLVAVPLCLLLILVAGVVYVLLNDFVVPVMYRQRLGAVAAWQTFFTVLKPGFWHFALYLLTRLGLAIAAGIGILALVVVTCCLAGCIMVIPYIGTVFLLPVSVFFRAFSVCYLRQFGPAFDAFPATRGSPPEQLPPQDPEPETAV
jgi:hypothetical protein